MDLQFTNIRDTLHLTLTFSYEGGVFTVIGHNPLDSPNSASLQNLWRLPHTMWESIDTVSVSAHVVNAPEDFQWQVLIAPDEIYTVQGPDMAFELGFPQEKKYGMEFGVRARAPSAERHIHIDLDNAEAPKPRPRPIIIIPPAPPDTTPPTGYQGLKVAWRPYPDHGQLVDLLIDDYLVERVLMLRRDTQPGSSLTPHERARLTRELYVHMNMPASARRAAPKRR